MRIFMLYQGWRLEVLKIISLRENSNYQRKVLINSNCRDELKWWIEEGLSSFKPISQGNPQYIIQSDSSKIGWGALLLGHDSETQGFWKEEEKCLHINLLELKAALLGTKALCQSLHDCHLQIQPNCGYIHKQYGGHTLTKLQCSSTTTCSLV